MLSCLPHFLRDGSKHLFILHEGLPKGVEQRFRIDRVADNPGMELGSRVFGVVLTEVEYKLEGVVANLEVVGISPFEPVGLLRVLICLCHQYPPLMVSNDGTISHMPETVQHHASSKSKFRTNLCWHGLCSSNHGSVTVESQDWPLPR